MPEHPLPDPAPPQIQNRPAPAAAAPAPQPHRGAASGAAYAISARPSARGAQRMRLHFRPPLRGEEGGEACAVRPSGRSALRVLEQRLLRRCVSEYIQRIYVPPPIQLCSTLSYYAYVMEERQKLRTCPKSNNPLNCCCVPKPVLGVGLVNKKHKNPRPYGAYILVKEADK